MDWRFGSVLLLALLPAALSSESSHHSLPGGRDCDSPPDAGRCRAAIRRFHWSAEKNKCVGFLYGGCGGNGNNFKTRRACRRACRPAVTAAPSTLALTDSIATTQESAPVTKRPTKWVYRKWKACYPSKSGAKCGPLSGQQKQRRVCVFVDDNKRTKPANCEGDRFLLRPCEYKKCPIDGGFSAWGNWTVCTATCGKGKRVRTRTCDNPPPQHGGQPCSGHYTQKEKCKLPRCPGKKPKTVCDRHPCLNGGTCSVKGSGFVCDCPKTHHGPICQFPHPGLFHV